METQNKLIIARYVRAYETGDVSDVEEYISVDFINRSYPAYGTGPDGVRHAVAIFHAGLSDIKCVMSQCVMDEDSAAFRITASGLHSGEFAGKKPTGQRVTWPSAEFVRFSGGKLVELWSVQDMLALMLGLGAKLS